MTRRFLLGRQIFFRRRAVRGWRPFFFHLNEMVGGRRRQISLVWRLVGLACSVGELARGWTWDVLMAGQQMSRVIWDMVTSPQMLARMKTDIVAAVKAAETVAGTVTVWNSRTPALGCRVRTLRR